MLLYIQHDKCLLFLKFQYYAHKIKVGKFLANRLKAQCTNSKISHTDNPFTNNFMHNPQLIADAFADIYDSLYILKSDASTPQPSDFNIETLSHFRYHR